MQSPSVSAAQILGHIEAFLDDFAAQLASQTPHIEETAGELSRRHVTGADDLRGHAEQHLQTWLAGHDADQPERVAQAMASLTAAQVMTALEAARHGGWQVLSNGPAPVGAPSAANTSPRRA